MIWVDAAAPAIEYRPALGSIYFLALAFFCFLGRLLPVEPLQIFPRLVRRSPLPMKQSPF
jgi:hypothetical protein